MGTRTSAAHRPGVVAGYRSPAGNDVAGVERVIEGTRSTPLHYLVTVTVIDAVPTLGSRASSYAFTRIVCVPAATDFGFVSH